MGSLTQSDFTTVLRFLRTNYIARDLPGFRQYVITTLPEVVRSEVTGYNEVDLLKWQDEHMVYPVERMDFPNSYELFNRHIREHPVINHLARTQQPAILRISDFVTHRQFARTALYQEFFRLVGTRDQISVTLKVGKRTVVGLALNHSRDYMERDRLLLAILQPHLVQAYVNALSISRLKSELDAARYSLEEANAAVIVLRPNGSVPEIAPFAQQLLEKYFDSQPRVRGLPEAIVDWIKGQSEQLERLSPPCPLVVRLSGKRLEIRMLSQNEQTLLLLSEKGGKNREAASSNTFATMGLTAREAEVLAWVARGRTNREIAQILGLSARTVQKHLEHIFRKLGVESRTAAATYVWETSKSLSS